MVVASACDCADVDVGHMFGLLAGEANGRAQRGSALGWKLLVVFRTGTSMQL